VFVIGYTLTVVPSGSAPAGTETEALTPLLESPKSLVTLVIVVDDAEPDVGVPKSDGDTPALAGGAAFVGPVVGGVKGRAKITVTPRMKDW
jgi:hypothetical protein